MKTNSFSQKFEQTILEISQESQQIDLAIKEWRFSGAFQDHGAPTARCELCGNTGLRYHFRVFNQKTGEALWVGSQCILNFDITGFDPNKTSRRSQKEKQQELRHQIDAKAIAELLLPLQQMYTLVSKSDRRKIHWAVGKFQRRGAFSPKDLAWLFQAMQILGIQYQSQNYPIILRSKQDRAEYTQLSITARREIDNCLTPEQRAKITG